MLRICPSCKRSYSFDSEYCNYCELDLPDGQLRSRFSTKPIRCKTMWAANFFACATFFAVIYTLILWGTLFSRAGILFACTFYWLHVLFYRKSHLKRMFRAKELMSHDTRPPVIYLRSFRRDNSPIAEERFFSVRRLFLAIPIITYGDIETFEERLAETLFRLGPTIAVNNPNTRSKVTDIGAARMEIDGEWKKAIEAICNKACFIVVMLDASDGILWEISVALKSSHSVRLFIVPPLQGTLSKRRFKKNYEIVQRLHDEFPGYQSELIAVLYPAGSSKGTVINSSARKPSPKQRLSQIAIIADSLNEQRPSCI